MALLLVLGVTTVLLVLGISAAMSARQELRLSRGESIGEQVSIAVESGFNEAAVEADADVNWPTTPFTSSSTPCVPVAPYPNFCFDAMARHSTSDGNFVVPVWVRYKVDQTSSIGSAEGWIVLDASNRVTRIVPNRTTCEPAEDPTSDEPCALGG